MELELLKDKSIMWCHWDLIRFLTEDKCDMNTSIIAECSYEELKDGTPVYLDYRIYLYKEDNKYIVQVYVDHYNYNRYEYNTFDEAINFMDDMPYTHKELSKRPMRIVNKQTLEIMEIV